MTKSPTCPYCNEEAKLVTGKEVYPHRPDLHSMSFYLCKPCDARVGCHQGSTRPLGRLANAELRKLRKRAHAAFDPLWKAGRMNRRQAYSWLAGKMGIDVNDCHIAMFDEEQCREVVRLCQQKKK